MKFRASIQILILGVVLIGCAQVGLAQKKFVKMSYDVSCEDPTPERSYELLYPENVCIYDKVSDFSVKYEQMNDNVVALHNYQNNDCTVDANTTTALKPLNTCTFDGVNLTHTMVEANSIDDSVYGAVEANFVNASTPTDCTSSGNDYYYLLYSKSNCEIVSRNPSDLSVHVKTSPILYQADIYENSNCTGDPVSVQDVGNLGECFAKAQYATALLTDASRATHDLMRADPSTSQSDYPFTYGVPPPSPPPPPPSPPPPPCPAISAALTQPYTLQ